MPDSTFRRLFRYAREGKSDALENFTTEALAAAIRADPEPLIRVLREQRVVGPTEEVAAVTPTTQVGIPSVGILDLVLDVRHSGGASELWIEVKVEAGESGQQLTNYRTHIGSLQPAVRPILLTVSRTPFGVQHELPWIPWQSIWRAARQATGSPYWPDFAQFLEEIRMADAFDAPIAAREAASISDAAALMAKTRRIIGLFAKEANVRWPEFRWPADEGPIQAMLGGQFARHRRLLVVAGLQFQAYLFAGVVSIEGEAHAAVWVETRNKAIEPRRRVISAADALPLGPEWERDPGAWGGLHKSARLVSFPSHEAVAGWLLASMAELEAAGILAMIPTLGTAEAADVTDDDDQAGMTAN